MNTHNLTRTVAGNIFPAARAARRRAASGSHSLATVMEVVAALVAARAIAPEVVGAGGLAAFFAPTALPAPDAMPVVLR